jgi:hypothetical protein
LRILLDNCVKKDLLVAFRDHEALHAVDMGWSALKNGELLRKASVEFDLLVTVDKNMRFQSSLKGLALRVAILDVRSNLLEDLQLSVAKLVERINDLPVGQFTVI